VLYNDENADKTGKDEKKKDGNGDGKLNVHHTDYDIYIVPIKGLRFEKNDDTGGKTK